MAARRPIGAWMLAALLCVAPAACLFTVEVPDGPCQEDSACDDANPCTRDACGINGYCSNEADDTLVPDDSNPCTEDVCSGGAAQNTSLPDGTACGLDDQLVCQAGKCKCATAAECGTNTACTKYACVDEACQSINDPEGTFVDEAGVEDCRKNVCDGAGGVVNVPDGMDFPGDSTPGDCQKKGCSADGTLINVPEENDVPGGDVPGDCRKKSCTAEGSSTDVPDVNDLPADVTVGDCQKPGCSPEGNVVSIDAPDDASPDDGNPCTMEGCNGGRVISGNVPNGTDCGAPASCGPNGSEFSQTTAETCQDGVCVTATSDTCGLYVCNGAACHVSCTTNAQCVPGAFCQGGLCKAQAAFGTPCTMDAECVSQNCTDGVCCNVACDGACQSCALPGQLGICGSIASGNPDPGCGPGELCNGAGLCKKENGETCAADGECLTGQCEDGVCCNVSCAGDCKRCDLPGNVGSCENVASGQTSGACMGTSACNGGGLCKKTNGAACAATGECLSNFCVEGVCCNTGCGGACKSCLGSKTGGANGTCANITDKTDPDDECAGTCNMATGNACCNGAGACNP